MLFKVILLGLILPAQSADGTAIFKWVDKQGNLHITDRLQDVPEPYAGMYAARIAAEEKNKLATRGKQPVAAPAVPAAPPYQPPRRYVAPIGQPSPITQAEEQQKYWRSLVSRWRGELAAATAELENADNEVGEANMNPLMRQTPEGQERARIAEEKRAQVVLRVNKARQMLLEEVPRRARAEGVPPVWLQ